MYKTGLFTRDRVFYLYETMPFARMHVARRQNGEEVGVLFNKDGSMQASWSFRGPDLDSAIEEQLAMITWNLNTLFASFGTGLVLYFEAQRFPSLSYADDTFFCDPVTRAIDMERRTLFSDGAHFESNYYGTIWWMPPSESEERMKNMVIEGRKRKEVTEEDAVDSFFEIADKILACFAVRQIPSRYLTPDELLTYIHSTISDRPRPIHLPQKPMLLDQYLYDSPFYGGIEPRLGQKHLRVIVPIKYRRNSVFGLFNQLNRINFSYRWMTRFICLGKNDALSELDTRKRGWASKMKSLMTMFKEMVYGYEDATNINENALYNRDEVRDAIAAVESDTTGYGFYSTAIIVTDNDVEAVEDKARFVRQLITNLGLESNIEGLNAVDAWMGSIPGNIGHDVRKPLVSTGNLVHMMPICDIWAGPERNDHLKAPVLLYTQTIGSTPFRLSLHIGDVGHTLLIGPTGAGKSVHLNLIEAQFRKYKNARIFIFDKGSSSRILTEGVGGIFYDLGNESLGLSFQPLSGVDDENERQWAMEWLCDYVTMENMQIDPEIKKLIWQSLSMLGRMPREFRTISGFINNLQAKDLKTAFRPLSIQGAYGKIFDAKQDTLTFSGWQAFEMEKLMATPAIVGPTLMYIFHKIEQQLTGRPTIIVLDECWVFFDNPMFESKIREWLKVLRKANASVIFATQSVTDVVNNRIFNTILESCKSRIFLPNDQALEKSTKETYKAFQLNDTQIQLIASAIPKRDYYYSSPMGCRLYDLGLERCPFTLAYVAVNKADLIECQRIIERYGRDHFNEQWLKYKNVQMPLEEKQETFSWKMEE